jgi:hypothetical protein
VVWHASQAVSLVMCAAFLPVAIVPLWQEKQLPITWV